MTDELKPCPFCGGEAGIADTPRLRAYWFMRFGKGRDRVHCRDRDCGAHFSYWHRDEWNRRAP